jgi:hypothetical protein
MSAYSPLVKFSAYAARQNPPGLVLPLGLKYARRAVVKLTR